MVIPKPYSQVHISIGNINIDLSLVVPRLPGRDEIVFASDAWTGPGGAATNYAVAVSMLRQRAVLHAVAGREAVALGVIEKLKSLGVDVSRVRMSSRPTGMVVVMINPGESSRSMVTIRGANEELDVSPSDLAGFRGHIHLASVKPELVEKARSYCEGCTISYDPGGESVRRPGDVIKASGHADWVFINTVELRGLTGSSDPGSSEALLRSGVDMVIVKHGRGGATVFTRGECYTIRRAPDVDIVDVTGAGDAFDASFNVWRLAGTPVEEALRYALAAGSAKVSKRGSSSMPLLDEVLEVLPRIEEPAKC